MRDTEFGAILNAEISGRAGEFNNIEGFTEIDGIRLTPQITDANGLGTDNDGYLTIVIRVDNSVFLEAESVKYLSMLPNDIFFALTFDVSESGAVLQDGYTGDESIVKYYYPSALKINNMYVPAETDDPSDPLFKDYENFSRILTVVNGGENPFDVSGVQYDFGCAIWEHFDKVRDAIGENNLKFTAKDSDNDPDVIDIEYGFLFGSVYDFLADTHEDDLTAENIKAGIQGMYPYDDACPNPNNYDYDLLVPDGEQLLDPAPALELGRTYDDNEFGAILKDGSELGLSGDNNPFSGGKYEIIRFSVATDETVPTLTHLAITLKMNVERNTDDFGDFRDGFWGFMPEEVYFTIYVDFDGLDYSASSDAYKLNLLTQAAEEELLEVTGFNMGANSNLLEAQTDAVVDLLNNTMVDLGGADIYLFKLLTYADGTVTMPGF